MQVYSEEQIGQKEMQSLERKSILARLILQLRLVLEERPKLLRVAKSAFEWTEGCLQGETPLS